VEGRLHLIFGSFITITSDCKGKKEYKEEGDRSEEERLYINDFI
jgi:hypothetical protein